MASFPQIDRIDMTTNINPTNAGISGHQLSQLSEVAMLINQAQAQNRPFARYPPLPTIDTSLTATSVAQKSPASSSGSAQKQNPHLYNAQNVHGMGPGGASRRNSTQAKIYHMNSERKRRQRMNELFDQMRVSLGCPADTNKTEILRLAVERLAECNHNHSGAAGAAVAEVGNLPHPQNSPNQSHTEGYAYGGMAMSAMRFAGASNSSEMQYHPPRPLFLTPGSSYEPLSPPMGPLPVPGTKQDQHFQQTQSDQDSSSIASTTTTAAPRSLHALLHPTDIE